MDQLPPTWGGNLASGHWRLAEATPDLAWIRPCGCQFKSLSVFWRGVVETCQLQACFVAVELCRRAVRMCVPSPIVFLDATAFPARSRACRAREHDRDPLKAPSIPPTLSSIGGPLAGEAPNRQAATHGRLETVPSQPRHLGIHPDLSVSSSTQHKHSEHPPKVGR